jgi:uncharacterized protein YecE (DUF72 family)
LSRALLDNKNRGFSEGALMGQLLIGTSGYDYSSDWKGVFYPRHLKQEEFLGYYAANFNALELNFSYYQMPNEIQLQKMVDRSGGKLKFSIKGNQEFTHKIVLCKWKDAVKEYIKGIEPLLKANLLTSVLLKFPNSFVYEDERRKYLAKLLDEFSGIPVVVEFRNDSWQRESVYAGLAARNAGFCVCDMPSIRTLPKFVPLVIAGKGYMRFHGRNTKNWSNAKTAADRFDYRYSTEELEKYVPFILDMTEKAQVMQVFFNNHAKGSAPQDAKALMTLLAP